MSRSSEKKKAPALQRQSLLDSLLTKESSNHITSQQRRLIAALSLLGCVSTIEARRSLDILSPAARIFELRECGWRIDTHWSFEPTINGRTKRVARYVLQSAPQPDGNVHQSAEALFDPLQEVAANG